ncbi:unnamed protein product [Effrenium voratum]|nr:unnamed protein product [Effrenium voratum]
MRADDSKTNLSSLPEARLDAEGKAALSPKGSESWAAAIDTFFKVTERGSCLQLEVRAGFINWMTMSYILVVNPVILGSADPESRITADRASFQRVKIWRGCTGAAS